MSYGDTVPAVKKPRRSPVRIRRDEACRRIASKIARDAPWVKPLDTLAIRAFAQLERLAIQPSNG
jgi:hypothetical protein